MISKLKEEFSFIHGNVLILMASWLLTDFAGEIPTTYYSLYVLELGATPFILGAIGSASSIALALGQFLGGYLADRHGRRQIILVMSTGVAACYILFAVALNWHFILIGTILQSLCLMYLPALDAITADSIPSEKRGLGYSITMLTRAVCILSPIIAGFLYITYGLVPGMRMAYWVVTIFFLVATIIRFKLKETLKTDVHGARLKDAFRDFGKAISEIFGVWKSVPESALILLLVNLIPIFFVRMCVPYYAIYATRVLLVDEFEYSLIVAWESIIFFGSLLLVGKLVDKIGRKKPLIASSILFALGMWLFIYGDMPKLYVAYLLFSIGNSLTYTAYPALQADIVPREHRGKVMGFSKFADNLIASVSLLAGGFLYENISPQLPFSLLLVSMIPTAILTLFLIHEPEKREK